MQVFLHFAQGVGQAALHRFEDALAFDMLVLALVEVAGRAVIFLEQLAVDLDRAARRFLMAGKERANHHHCSAKAHAFGDVAMVADAAIGDDRFGRDTGTPFQGRKLPAAGAETGFQPCDADLAGADADLGRVSAPVFQVDHRFGRADIAGDDEAVGQTLLDMRDHPLHAVGMAMRNVDGDVVGANAFSREPVDYRVVGGLHA